MTNEAMIKEMIEKRNSEPDVEEKLSLVGELDLEEVESLKMENIALKKEQLRMSEMQLLGEQEQLMKRIRERLGVTDDYGISFNFSMTKVKVERRRAENDGQKELDSTGDEARS